MATIMARIFINESTPDFMKMPANYHMVSTIKNVYASPKLPNFRKFIS